MQNATGRDTILLPSPHLLPHRQQQPHKLFHLHRLQLFDPPSAVTTDHGDEDESDLDLLDQRSAETSSLHYVTSLMTGGNYMVDLNPGIFMCSPSIFPIFDQRLSDGQLAYWSRGDTGSLVWESRS